MTKVSNKRLNQLIKKYNINTDVVTIETLRYAVHVELEHGRKLGKLTNITNDSIETSFQIALAHLTEFSNYYEYLQKMETKLDKYWSSRTRKSIYNVT